MNRDLRVVIVGPLPPPAGGMAGQTLQLLDLLTADGIAAEVVRTNPPYRPRFVGRLRGVRAAVRLVPYASRLWRAAGRASVFHIMANSGWAWHLFAAPAIWVGKLRGARVIVNYRGGLAEPFLAGAPAIVRRTLGWADAIAVPSEFLRAVFARNHIDAKVIPNVVDLERFAPAPAETSHFSASVLCLVIARNLEAIYDIPTAVRAFVKVQAAHGGARLVIAGSGSERAPLVRLVADLGVQKAVEFAGDLDRDAMVELYRSADIVINSSVADNAPNFILEALACGKPVVSTDAGGIPFIVRHRVTALLVPPRDPAALALAVTELLADADLRGRLVRRGLELVQRFSWHTCVRCGATSTGETSPPIAGWRPPRAGAVPDASQRLHRALRGRPLSAARACQGSRFGKTAARARAESMVDAREAARRAILPPTRFPALGCRARTLLPAIVRGARVRSGDNAIGIRPRRASALVQGGDPPEFRRDERGRGTAPSSDTTQAARVASRWSS